MKKIELITRIILALAVVGLYVLYFWGDSFGKPAGNAPGEIVLTTGEAAPEGSIVYIQIDSLINGYDMYHDLNSELETKAKGMEDDLSKRSKTFERSVNDYREKVTKGLITRSQAEQQEQQLAQKQQELAAYSEKLRQELDEEGAVMLRRIYDAIVTYLQEYNREHNYSLIISTSAATNVIMQGHPGLNITQEVKNGLNAAYVRPKK
ncbi:MAG: OmpH family outer membrane protein [Prevotellaceae bacterium]|jgi:outer membrane protein|nr:OmpH family outer membrane protein [Prevotellaceae bacterium]